MDTQSNLNIKVRSVEEMQSYAARLAAETMPGTVIALIGDLGSGKTTFAQGFAKGLGVDQAVGSPTFKLISEYSGTTVKLYHVDCYRIKQPGEFLNIGGEEYLHPVNGITVIEWADIIQDVLPDSVNTIEFSRRTDNPDVRVLTLKGFES